ncbi:MAG: hypothetical protein ACK5XN_40185 [Bacteroidota bacterium]
MTSSLTHFETELRDLCLKHAADWDQSDWLNMAVSLMTHAASAIYSVDTQHPERMTPFSTPESMAYYADPRREILAPLVSLMAMSLDDRESDWNLLLECLTKILGQHAVTSHCDLVEANDIEGILDYQESRVTICCNFLTFVLIIILFPDRLSSWSQERQDKLRARLMKGFFKVIQEESARQDRIDNLN